MKKVLIPYFLAGSGHLVSATAIYNHLLEKGRDWEIRLFEPSDELSLTQLDSLYKRSWSTILKRPLFGTIVFFLSEHVFSFITRAINKRVMKASTRPMVEFLTSYKPDLIVTTHWGCGHLAAAAMKAGAPACPLFVVRNDLGGAYKLQKVDCDRIIVMSTESVEAFEKLGIPSEKILQVNPIVRSQFMNGGSIEKEGKGELTLLLTSGGEGIGNKKNTASIILKIAEITGRKVSIDILTGRNNELREKLKVDMRDPRVTLHGYREDVDKLIRKADIVVGKCGANSTMETVMSGTPFLITQIGAPNEHPNKDYIVNRGYGWYARNFRSFTRIITRIFEDDEEIAGKLKNLSKRPTVNGAAQIADAVHEAVERK